MKINQTILVEKTVKKFVEKDVSYEVADVGTLQGNMLVLHNGVIDKDVFNKMSLEHADYPRSFDRDCHYTIKVDNTNGKLSMDKTSGIGTWSEYNNQQIGTNEHTPEYVGARPPVKRYDTSQQWKDKSRRKHATYLQRPNTMKHYHLHQHQII